MTYKAPEFRASSFNCPHCGAFAHMRWDRLRFQHGNSWPATDMYVSACIHCSCRAYWLGTFKDIEGTHTAGVMLSPGASAAPMSHPEMPADVAADYQEARDIAAKSPRAAAALLRLCVQKLCVHLGEPGQNINADIAALVRKGLPEQIQQALDVVRVVGNNAVHPGQMSNDDVAEVCNSLFGLVNYIVEDRIARPAKVKSLYEGIPQPLRDAIAERDGKPQDTA